MFRMFREAIKKRFSWNNHNDKSHAEEIKPLLDKQTSPRKQTASIKQTAAPTKQPPIRSSKAQYEEFMETLKRTSPANPPKNLDVLSPPFCLVPHQTSIFGYMGFDTHGIGLFAPSKLSTHRNPPDRSWMNKSTELPPEETPRTRRGSSGGVWHMLAGSVAP